MIAAVLGHLKETDKKHLFLAGPFARHRWSLEGGVGVSEGAAHDLLQWQMCLEGGVPRAWRALPGGALQGT